MPLYMRWWICCGTRPLFFIPTKDCSNDGRCLACRGAVDRLPARSVDCPRLPTGPSPRLARLRRAGLGGAIVCVSPALLDQDGARPRLAARVRKLPARHLQAEGLVRRPSDLADHGE